MFSNLNAGSVLYILNTKDKLKLTTGQITGVTPPRAKSSTFGPGAYYGQLPDMIMDIVATVDGERREFKSIPTNSTIANFSDNNFILADSRESMLSQVNTMLQNSKSIIDNIDKHKNIVRDCNEILINLNPSLAAEAQRDNAINNLQSQVNVLTEQLSKLVSALGTENKPKQ